jgi:hypothetical protein
MPAPRPDRKDARPAADRSTAPVYYPENRLLGVVDSPAQVTSAVEALTAGGFLVSEVEVTCGQAQAERVAASTGRRGLLDLVIRVAERLGLADDEIETKGRYEQALRDGGLIVSVLASTDERKARAADIVRAHGGHLITFFGRLTIEKIAP